MFRKFLSLPCLVPYKDDMNDPNINKFIRDVTHDNDLSMVRQ